MNDKIMLQLIPECLMPDYKERDYICIGIDGSLSETVRAYFATEPGGYLKLTDEIKKV